jgi:hypothetical protein
MPTTGDGTIQVKLRITVSLIVLALFFGFAAFTKILGEPRFQVIRSPDVVRLITIGACWGAAGLALLIGSKFRRG